MTSCIRTSSSNVCPKTINYSKEQDLMLESALREADSFIINQYVKGYRNLRETCKRCVK